MRTQKGITLVALIITIVVLLILAAVSISAIQDGGLVDKASGAVSQWNDAQNKEESVLQGYGNYLNNYIGGCKHTDAYTFYAHGPNHYWNNRTHILTSYCPDCRTYQELGEEEPCTWSDAEYRCLVCNMS